MTLTRFGSIIIFIALNAAAMAETPSKIERHYDAAKGETTYRFMHKLEKRSNGELDLFGMFKCPGTECTTDVERFTLAVLWIGLERMFSTPAAAAVEVDGEQIHFGVGRHGAEIEGDTVDESVAFDIPRAVLKRMTEGTRVLIRAGELRVTLSESHIATLRQLLRAASPPPK